MAKRNKGKPKSPEQIAADRLAARARDLEAVNLPPEGASLPSYADVKVSHAERDKLDGAERQDAFSALKAEMAKRNPGAYDAARRLERDIAARRCEADRGRSMERVDASDGGDFTDRSIEAGERLDIVLAKISPRDRWLLTELIRPSPAREGPWRPIVAYITGEENPVAQGVAVRCACANLCEAYAEYDRDERTRKAAKQALVVS